MDLDKDDLDFAQFLKLLSSIVLVGGIIICGIIGANVHANPIICCRWRYLASNGYYYSSTSRIRMSKQLPDLTGRREKKCPKCLQVIDARQSRCHHCHAVLKGTSLGRIIVLIILAAIVGWVAANMLGVF